MYQLVHVDSGLAAAFARFTYRGLAPLLARDGADPDVVALGALEWGKPVGAALGAVSRASAARLLSIAVASEHRHSGAGTALLAGLEQALIARGCRSIRAAYLSDSPSRSALEALLRKLGWDVAQPQTVLYRGLIRTAIRKLPWVLPVRVAAPFRFVAWDELPVRAREEITAGAGLHTPEAMDPRYRIERNSVALLRDGEVAGWSIAHRVLPDTIRYSSAFVREDLRKTGRGAAIIGESIRRHGKEPLASEAPIGIFHVRVDNRSMLEFASRRLAPGLESAAMTYMASKALFGPEVAEVA